MRPFLFGLGEIDLSKVEQIDDLTFSHVNGVRSDIQDWLVLECSYEHTIEGYQDGGRVRITFADRQGAMDFKLRWFQT